MPACAPAGMFTSPHLVSFRERFRLNGRPMAEHAFLGHFWHVWDGLHAAAPAERDEEDDADVPPVPGFFHLLTLLALAAFSREKVDVLVLEVGLGGRLDATNVVPRPVACGITRLDYDHVEVLGGTMAAIAAEVSQDGQRRPSLLLWPHAPAAAGRVCSLARRL